MNLNKKIGNSFEQDLCELLYEKGFWVHNLAQNQSGQPADIIAVINSKPYLIDAKVCSDNKFPLSRIEENQKLSMDLWGSCKNGVGWFAFLIDGEVFMMAYSNIKEMQMTNSNKTVLTLSDIVDKGMTFEKWVLICM